MNWRDTCASRRAPPLTFLAAELDVVHPPNPHGGKHRLSSRRPRPCGPSARRRDHGYQNQKNMHSCPRSQRSCLLLFMQLGVHHKEVQGRPFRTPAVFQRAGGDLRGFFRLRPPLIFLTRGDFRFAGAPNVIPVSVPDIVAKILSEMPKFRHMSCTARAAGCLVSYSPDTSVGAQHASTPLGVAHLAVKHWRNAKR